MNKAYESEHPTKNHNNKTPKLTMKIVISKKFQAFTINREGEMDMKTKRINEILWRKRNYKFTDDALVD